MSDQKPSYRPNSVTHQNSSLTLDDALLVVQEIESRFDYTNLHVERTAGAPKFFNVSFKIKIQRK